MRIGEDWRMPGKGGISEKHNYFFKATFETSILDQPPVSDKPHS